MNKILIGIHGLGNKPPRDLLNEWWKISIREGLAAIAKPNYLFRFELVYWADLLYPHSLDPHETNVENPLYINEPYAPSQPSELPKARRIFRKKIFDYIENRLDSLFLRKDMSLNFSSLTNTIIRRYFKDLEAYYKETAAKDDVPSGSTRKLIQEKLISVLHRHRKKDIILIAHSMGSIIAYDVLIQNLTGIKIHTLVTLGSPLGFPAIISRIFNEQKIKNEKKAKVYTPESIKYKWYNFSDESDTICLDRSLADDFAPNKMGVRAEDFRVYNDFMFDGKKNPHKIYGYLRTKEFSATIDSLYYQRHFKFISRILELINRMFSRIFKM